MEKKFGPGSEFEKKIKQKYGPGSDLEKKMKALGEDMERKAREQHKKPEASHSEAAGAEAGSKKSKPAAKPKTRDQRIKALEAQVQQLLGELKALKEADADHQE